MALNVASEKDQKNRTTFRPDSGTTPGWVPGQKIRPEKSQLHSATVKKTAKLHYAESIVLPELRKFLAAFG